MKILAYINIWLCFNILHNTNKINQYDSWMNKTFLLPVYIILLKVQNYFQVNNYILLIILRIMSYWWFDTLMWLGRLFLLATNTNTQMRQIFREAKIIAFMPTIKFSSIYILAADFWKCILSQRCSADDCWYGRTSGINRGP